MTVQRAFEVKSFQALDQAQGIFEALVAVFGNVDRAGDVILPGAFKGSLARWAESGRPLPVIFAHDWDNLDAHIGQVLDAHETDDGLYVKAQLEMDEPFAQRVWKKMQKGLLVEFSFAYDVLEATVRADGVRELRELELLEVGPCLKGMNPATRLLGVKAAFRPHSTPTSTKPWDGPANEARARSGESPAYYRRIFAWQDPDGDPTVKSSYRFIHHEVSADGEPGAANVRACQTGIAVLNGARGGTTIPDADRQGVWEHLARHLRDADVEPPELKALTPEVKYGRRNSAADQERIQRLHDLAVELGAVCPGAESAGETDAEDKAGGAEVKVRPGTLAARVAAELLEIG